MLQSTDLHSVKKNFFVGEQLYSIYFNTVFLFLTAATVKGVK